jgi:putative colanic acid biosysnthesis UDP-glucose lipid carrier transferase
MSYGSGCKRGFDFCLAAMVLLVTGPLLLLTAIGIKLRLPGPVFFRQTRMGLPTERAFVNVHKYGNTSAPPFLSPLTN